MQINLRHSHMHELAVIMCRLLSQEKHFQHSKFSRGGLAIFFYLGLSTDSVR